MAAPSANCALIVASISGFTASTHFSCVSLNSCLHQKSDMKTKNGSQKKVDHLLDIRKKLETVHCQGQVKPTSKQ